MVQTLELKSPLAHYFWRQMTPQMAAFIDQCRIRNFSHCIGLHVYGTVTTLADQKNPWMFVTLDDRSTVACNMEAWIDTHFYYQFICSE